MNPKIKRFFFALTVSLLLTIVWLIFLNVTLIGVIYWYASDQMGIAILLSMVVPTILYTCFKKRENESFNKKFFYSSLFAAILILFFVPEQTERAGIGFLILPIVLVLNFTDGRSVSAKNNS